MTHPPKQQPYSILHLYAISCLMKKLLIASIRDIQGILPLTGRDADRIHAFDQALQWIVHALSRDGLSILSPPPCPDTGKALMRFAVFVCAHPSRGSISFTCHNLQAAHGIKSLSHRKRANDFIR